MIDLMKYLSENSYPGRGNSRIKKRSVGND